MARQTDIKIQQPGLLGLHKNPLSKGTILGERKIEKSKQGIKETTIYPNAMQNQRNSSAVLKYSILAIAIGSLLYQNQIMANPTGGKVVAGSAQIIQKAPGKLDIIQNSHKAVIDWRGFSIAKGEHTRFRQPSSSAIALNRVRGGQASLINGALTANGNVWLINPNGVLFGKSAQVNVRGLMATTSDINNEDFMAGRYLFDQQTDNSNAAIVNQGQIEVTDGGSIILAGPRVSNEGSIKAKLGHVVLASGDTFTMDFHGDGLLQFDIGEPVKQPIADGQTATLVSNQGKITVDGGIVEMTTRTRNEMVERVINMEGVIQAKAVGIEGGTIILSGGEQGIVAVSGLLDVSGKEQGQVGGVAKILGQKVGLLDGAEIDASGDAGGGEVLVGGNFQGKGAEQNARRTLVANNVEVTADALSEGDGGRVIVWSDEVTEFKGTIDASAGENAGDGGFVEVSGKKTLGFNGVADVSSKKGKDGSVLLDPENIRIVESGGQNNNEISDGEWLFQDGPTSGDSTVDAASVEALLGDIIFQATQDIHIDAALNLQNQEKGERVVFQAGNNININANIQSTGTDSDTSPGPDLFIEADSQFASANEADGKGTVNINDVMIEGFGATHLIGADFNIDSFARINSTVSNSIGPSTVTSIVLGSGILNGPELNTFSITKFGLASFRVGRSESAGANGKSTNSFITAGTNISETAVSKLTIDQPITLDNAQQGGGQFFAIDVEINSNIQAVEVLNVLFYDNFQISNGAELISKAINLINFEGSIGIGSSIDSTDVNFNSSNLGQLKAESLELQGFNGVTVNGLKKEDLDPKVTRLRIVSGLPTAIPPSDNTAPIEFVTTPTDLSGINLIAETIGNIVVNAPIRAENIDFSADDLNLNASVSGSGQLKIQHAAASDRKLRSDKTPNIIIGNQNSNLQGLTLTSDDLRNISDGFSKILINSDKSSEKNVTFIIGNADFLDSVEFSTGSKGNITLDGRLTADGSINFNGTNDANGITDIALAGSIATPSQPILINQNAVLGGNLEINTTLGGTQGASLDFPGTLDGNFNLTLDTGNLGNIRFSSDVGGQTALADVTVARANNINFDGAFIAGDTRIQHLGDFTTGANGLLDVNSLFVNPSANSATLSGLVAGAAEKQTATQVEGPIDDPQFTINGCVIGVECEDPITTDPDPVPQPESEIKPAPKSDLPIVAEPRSNTGLIPIIEDTNAIDSLSSIDRDKPGDNVANFDNNSSSTYLQTTENLESARDIFDPDDEQSDEALQTAKNDELNTTNQSASDYANTDNESSNTDDQSTENKDSVSDTVDPGNESSDKNLQIAKIDESNSTSAPASDDANPDNESSNTDDQSTENKESVSDTVDPDNESSKNDPQTTKNDESNSTDDSESTEESANEEDESESEEESEKDEVKAPSSKPSPLVPMIVQIQRPSYNPTTYQYSNLGNSELWDDIPDINSVSSFAAFYSPSSQKKMK